MRIFFVPFFILENPSFPAKIDTFCDINQSQNGQIDQKIKLKV